MAEFDGIFVRHSQSPTCADRLTLRDRAAKGTEDDNQECLQILSFCCYTFCITQLTVVILPYIYKETFTGVDWFRFTSRFNPYMAILNNGHQKCEEAWNLFRIYGKTTMNKFNFSTTSNVKL